MLKSIVCCRVLLYFKLVFAGTAKSGCKFPKFHLACHYHAFMKEYGVPALTYSGWWEKAHRFLVKMPYLRTGRKTRQLAQLLMLRVALSDRVNQMKYILEKAKGKGKVRAFTVREPSGHTVTVLRVAAGGLLDEHDTRTYTKAGFDEDGYFETGLR